LLAAAVVLYVGSDAAAGPDPATALSFAAAPVFGADAATGKGWNEVVARVDNAGESPQRGVLELSMTQTWGSGEPEVAGRAAFAVPAGKSAVVAIPMHGFAYYAPQVTLTARSPEGRLLESLSIPFNGSVAPLLVAVDQTTRLTSALRGWPIDSKWAAGGAPAGSNALTVSAPAFDRATGDPVLPERAAEYASATAVIIHSSRLVALDDAKRDALLGWVSSGGTLAVVASRPEDLRSPVLTSLVGGETSLAPPETRLSTLPAYEKPDASTLGSSAPPPANAHRSRARSASPSDDEPRVVRVGPSAEVSERLTGYAGGNLHPSDFGATAAFGLGEVHLLPFDPAVPSVADDLWTQTRVVALVTRAWDRRARVAFPVGGADRAPGYLDRVRRALDPNENFRVGLGVSALLLVLYSVIVGPLVFARAAKRGLPLAPLKWVPAWSAAAFAAIVVVGLAGKGWRGRARHLTLLEAGSGASRANLRTYRGFFASETQSLSFRPLVHASLLSVAPTEGMTSHTSYGTLAVDRDEATLAGLTSLPWQTVVVREDGIADVGDGIALVPTADGALDIVNGSGHALKDVLVRGARDGAYFEAIDRGARVPMSAGRPLRSLARSGSLAGSPRVHPLESSSFASELGAEGTRIAAAWGPLEAAAGDAVDWWPDDTPVLLAEVDAKPRAPSDSGLSLESDRVLIRVVGSLEARP
jgi:hypothetical protein